MRSHTISNFNNKLVSVIVPIYNTEKYLAECLDSIIAQAHKNLEIILVNDGSTDGSRAICQEYVKKDMRVKLINQKNTGQAVARANGVKKSRAEYVCFVDSDDVVSKTYVADLLGALISQKTQIAVCGVMVFQGEIPHSNINRAVKLIAKTGLVKLFGEHTTIGNPTNWIMQSLNAKIYHRALLENLNYDLVKTNVLEDNIISAQILNRVKDDRIAVIDQIDYFYRVDNSGATMQNSMFRMYKNEKKSLNYLELVNLVSDTVKKIFSSPEGDLTSERLRTNHYYDVMQILRSQRQAMEDKDKIIHNQSQEIIKQQESIEQARGQLTHQSQIIMDLRNSRSYKLGRMMLFPLRAARSVTRRFKAILIKADFFVYRLKEKKFIDDFTKNAQKPARQYFIKEPQDLHKTSDIAVVLHLFYADLWPTFLARLKMLKTSTKFDLFITLPTKNQKYIEQIQRDWPSAQVFVVPNQGRDVLPFIEISKILSSYNYQNVLKIHSKKSKHIKKTKDTESGEEWLENLLEALIPRDTKTRESLIKATHSKNFAVASAEQYYFPQNIGVRQDFLRSFAVLTDIYKKDFAQKIIEHDLGKYGFFAGTMFWVRLDAIKDLLKYDQRYFEGEEGQILGTLAHAMERLFCLLPELNHKTILGIENNSVHELEYQTARTPHWFEDKKEIKHGKHRKSR